MRNIIGRLRNSRSSLSQVDMLDLIIEIDAEQKKALQNILLAAYINICSACKRHQITPFLVGGSALGAVRHKGFIPWDDDLDIGMTRADYQKFSGFFEEELSERYILCAPNYKGKAKSRFPKIIIKDTVLREIVDEKDDNLCGVFIDIFVLDNVPDNKLVRVTKGCFCNMLEFIAGQVYLFQQRDALTKTLYCRGDKTTYYIRMMIGCLFSGLRAGTWHNMIDKCVQHSNDQSLFCSLATGRKHYFGEMMLRSELLPIIYGEFCGEEVALFRNVDAYLKNLYGNYMEVPPIEKRERHFIREMRLEAE